MATTGNDTINGTTDPETIDGLAGNDYIFGDAGADSLVGNDGHDTIDGGLGNDTLDGGNGDDWFFGGAGNDSLVGGAGYDRANYRNAAGSVVVDMVAGLATSDGDGGMDTLVGIERVMGSEFNDTIVGSAAADDFSGNQGDDVLDGGSNFDTVWYGSATSSIVADLGTGIVTGGEGNDTLTSIEGITGSSFADSLTGSSTDEYFRGDGGAGGGNDTIDGKGGFDVVDYRDDPGGVQVDLADGIAIDGRGNTDTLISIEEARGSQNGDTLWGSSGDEGAAYLHFERFEGQGGDDVIDGGHISDTLNQKDGNQAAYSNATAAVVVDLQSTSINSGSATGGAGNDVLLNINEVRGSGFDDTIRGSDRTDITEVFEGRAGNDSIDGRGGFDIVRFETANGSVNASLVTGTATVGTQGTDTFTNVEGLWGSRFDDSLVGGNALNGTTNTSSQSEFFVGNGGNDTIDGGQGYDVAAYHNSTSAVNVTLNDTADGSASDGLGGTDVLRNIEGVRGSAFDDTLTGSDTAIFESFEGREGNDTIDGKGGTDRADYFRATSGTNVNLSTGTASDGYGFTDTLLNIENVRGARDFGDTIVGSSGANKIEALGGNDSVAAGAGNDTILAGTGVDTVDGGLGFDRIVLQGKFDGNYNSEVVDATTIHIWNTITGEDITASNVELIVDSTGQIATAFEVRAFMVRDQVNTAPVFAPYLPGTFVSQNAFSSDGVKRVAFHADGSFTVFGQVNDTLMELRHFDANGHIDLNYGGDGRAHALFSSAFTARDMEVDGAGRVLVSGWLQITGGFKSVVARFDTQGNLDSTFGTGGVVATDGRPFVTPDDRIRGMAIDNNGKIVVVGQAADSFPDGTGPWRDFLVMRYNADGSLDNTFNGNGVKTLSFGPSSEILTDVQILGDNSIIAWGTTQSLDGSQTSAVLLHFNADGSQDLTFNQNAGFTSIPLGQGAINVAARSIAMDASGKFVVLTAAPNGAGGQMLLVARINANGTMDTTFNGDGDADGIVPLAVGTDENGWKVIVQADGKILVASETSIDDFQDNIGSVVRLNSDGSLDTAFGDGGMLRGPFDDGYTMGDVAVDGTGRILVIGNTSSTTLPSDINDGWVGRYTSAGVLDTSFNVQNSLAGKIYAPNNGGTVAMLFDGGSVYDVELAARGNYGGSTLTVQRTGGAVATDQFSVAGGVQFAGGVVTVDGTPVGTVTNANGTLTIAFNNNANQLDVNDVINHLNWVNNSVTAGTTVHFDWTFNDGDAGGAQSVTGTSDITVLAVTVGNTGDGSDNVVWGTGGNDTLDGGGGDDYIVGLSGNDLLKGGTGNDSMVGYDGADTAIGGAGDDSLNGGDINDRVNYSDGNTLNYSDSTAGIVMDLSGQTGGGNLGVGIVHDGMGGIDTVKYFNFIVGSNFNDSILGSSDSVFEMFEGGLGNDTINGGLMPSDGSGSNRANYINATGSVTVDLGAGTASGADGNDVLINIVGVRGSSHNDVIWGSNRTDFTESLDGRAGADDIDGKGGFDIVRNDAGGMTTGVIADLGAGRQWNDGFGNTDTLTGIEGVYGSGGADSLTGSNATGYTEVFRGNAGNDTIDGAGGTDRADYTTGGNAVVTLNDTIDGTASDGLGGTDVLRNIENILAGGGNDTITGNSANNSLEGGGGDDSIGGGAGNDTVLGGDGNDFLVGNTGNDSMSGGNGNDFIVGNEGADSMRGGGGNDVIDGGSITDRINYTDGNTLNYTDSSAGIAMNLSGITGNGESGSGTVQDGFGGTDTVSRANFVLGSDWNDSILGSSARIFEQFEGRGGNDTLDGGAITDTLNGTNNNRVNYSGASGGVTVDFQAGTANGAAGTDQLTNFNQVRGSAFGDVLNGSNTTAITEQFDGRAGNDTIDGRGGSDFLRYDSAATTGVNVNLASGTASDGQGGTDTFSNIEGVYGSNFDDVLTGGNAANGTNSADTTLSEVFRGGGGNDYIDGGVGYDRVDFSASTSSVIATLGGTGDGFVTDDGQGGHDTIVGIEGLRGSAFDDTLTGSDSGIFESFEGKEGADVIDGKGGIDRVDYRTSEAGVNVNLAGNTAQDGWGFTDSISNIENVRGSRDGNDTITGSAVANLLEGVGGNDNLSGAAGNDTLDGGQGVDTVDGGADSDTVVLHGSLSAYSITVVGSDLRLVNGATNEDVIVRNVESFQFTDGTRTLAQVQALAGGDQGLNGDGGNNSLIGGTGDDNINGNGGNDTLRGNDGNDFLTGGAGADLIDGANGWDTANYNDAGTTGGVTVSLTTNLATGGAGSDTLSGIEAVQGSNFGDNITGSAVDNYIAGNGGNDTINGGDGNDNLDGGLGNDSLVGGNGWDTVDYGSATAGVNVNLVANTVTGAAGTDTLSGIENVSGSNGNDTILGSAGDNWIQGNGGNDSIAAGAGWDNLSYNNASGSVSINLGTGIVTGAAGTDTVSGFEAVQGSNFDDSIVGDTADNVLSGGLGNDTLDGGAGAGDMANYSEASGGVSIDLANGKASGAAGTDALNNIENAGGSWHADTIIGSIGNNYIDGSFGADYIDGNSGFDTVGYGFALGGVSVNLATGVVGGSESDTLVGIEGVNGSNLNDTLTGDGNNNSFTGGQGNDTIDGAGGTADSANYWDATGSVIANLATTSVSGGAGNDVLLNIENLNGSSFNDSLTGSATNNNLWGDAGNDTLDGGAGNDFLTGGAGNDLIIGGADIDRADLSVGATAGINVTLNNGAATLTGGAGADTLSGIENITGTGNNDTITGDVNANSFSGNDGNDSLSGGAGNDNLNGDNGSDTLVGGLGNDNLFGGAGNDSMLGNEGADFLRGSAGNDTIDGGVVLERTNMSDGNSLSYGDATAGIVMNLSGITGDGSTGTGTVQDGLGGTDTVANVQFITGSGLNDSILGSSARIFEMFEGGTGDDTIDGGAITDTLNGTNGNRANYANASGAVSVTLSGASTDGFATGAAGNDTLRNINQVRGGFGNDTLTGTNRNDLTEAFEGRAGDDLIDGMGGFDIVRYDTFGTLTGGVTVDLVAGTASGGGLGNDTLLNIEGVYGGNFDDTLIGGNAANGTTNTTGQEIFRGGAGNDFIDGGQGYDRVDYTSNGTNTGGVGADVTLGGTGTGTANDGMGGTDTLVNIEAVRGSEFGDTLTGSDTGTFESFEGMAGADKIDGKGGFDRADYSRSTAGITVNLTTGAAADGWGSNDTLAGIECVRGSGFNDSITGSASADSLEGGGGNDTLVALDGDDVISGGGGANTVDGGAGNDTLLFTGKFTDYIVSRTATDTILTSASLGQTHTVRGVEAFAFSDGTLTLSEVQGNSLSEFADDYTGTEGPDPINGLGGNDTLTGLGGNDTINGGAGSDTMVGGLGDDVYTVDNPNDVITELEGEGTDLVNVQFLVAGTFDMGAKAANVENATVLGTVAAGVIGNALDNVITGNAGANSLSGGAGNDTLDGGAGTDTLVGGAGDDTYVIDVSTDVINETLAGSGNDTVVVKFASGAYVLGAGIENAIAVGTTPTAAIGLTGNALANGLAGNDGANSLSGGDGDDQIDGNGGNDTILGGNGGDFLTGGAGNDSIDGGAITDRQNYFDGNAVSYDDGSTTGITANLATGIVSDGFGGTDTVKNVTFFFGSQNNDSILGSSSDLWESFDGLGGNDTINGGAITNYFVNSNRASYSNATSAVTVDLGLNGIGSGTATGGGGNDVLLNINEVRGSKYDDFLSGSDRLDMPEVFEGRAGNNTIDGKGGFDYVSYLAAVGKDGIHGVTVNLASGTGGSVVLGWTDTFTNIEGVWGSHFDDTLVGSNNAAGTTEVFRGNGGWDSIDGGAGWDMVDYVTSHKGIVLNFATGSVQDGWFYTPTNQGTDTLANIEAVRGSDFGDSLTGSSAFEESFEGRGGNDTIDGAGGFINRASYVTSTAGANVNLTNTFTTGGTATDGLGGTDVLKNITDVWGSRFNDTILGSAGMNYLVGFAGNDSINGAEGDDTVEAGTATGTGDTVDGGAGTDTLALLDDFANYKFARPNAGDTVITNTTTGEIVTVRNVESFDFAGDIRGLADLWGNAVSNFDDVYSGSDEIDDVIDGLAGNDSLSGLGGNDTIIGGAGNDTLVGGLGDDVYTVDNANDVITELADEGTDRVNVQFLAAGTFDMNAKAANVEDATVTGTVAAGVIGNSLDNTLTGNAGANSLSGGAGDDTLVGAAGNDTLVGGTGDDTYVIDVATDVVNETLAGGGTADTVQFMFNAAGTYTLTSGIENAFIGNGTAVTITGNELANTITGNGANNILNGGLGDDTLSGGTATGTGDTLDGGAGTGDTVNMIAASGNYTMLRLSTTDTRLTTTSGEVVVLRNVEFVHFSDDVVLSMGDIWGNNPSAFADDLEGTDGNDPIDGLAGNDTIHGLEGNDTLIGGAGIDSLVGGTGDDVYSVDVATDVIVELADEGADLVNVAFAAAGVFNMALNAANVERGTVTSAGTIGAGITGNALDNVLTGNAAGNALTGGEGNDTLDGLAGNDTLAGGAGNDVYFLSATTDVVNETVAGSGGTDTVNLLFGATATYTLTTNVENGTVANGTNAVNITGNASANILTGNSANNVLNGAAGNDTIAGSGGNDTVDGGTESDTLVLAGAVTDYIVTRPTLTSVTFTKPGTTVTTSNIEWIQFDEGDAIAITTLTQLVGSPGADNLVGGAGDDTLDGAASNDTVSGLGGNDTLFGGAGNDTIIGGADDDVLNGNDGIDVYRHFDGDGDDLIVQNDTVTGVIDKLEVTTSGSVTFTRGWQTYDDLVVNITRVSGDDETVEHVAIVDFFANDTITGGTVDQVVVNGAIFTQAQMSAQALVGGNGETVFVGYGSNDTIVGSDEADWISAGAGNDAINAGAGDDMIFGGAGNDVLNAFGGNDTMVGGAGNDTMTGTVGDDWASGGAGSDTYMFGPTAGHDIISEKLFDLPPEAFDSGIGPRYVVSDGDSPLNGDVDTITINGTNEADVRLQRVDSDLLLTIVSTGATATVLDFFANGVSTIERINFAQTGTVWTATTVRSKVLIPTDGNDSIVGYSGGEKLNGLAGEDVINGGAGNDTINGGAGDDILTGGTGADRFVLAQAPGGEVDTITDFVSGTDTIALSAAAFTGLVANGFNVGTKYDINDDGAGLWHYLSYDSGTGELSYDADGDGAGAAVVIAIIGWDTHPDDLGRDFLIVA